MEVTVSLFKALANEKRIQILRVLSCLGEQSVSDIAQAVDLRPNLVSDHLAVLTTTGVVWKRRSGRRVYYRIADSPSREIVREIVAVLRGVFRHVRTRDPRQVAASDQAESTERSDRALFACFTAFTHPRRLQLIRHLTRQGPLPAAVLCEQLSMSPQACNRHVAKLSRRGYMRKVGPGREKGYAIIMEGDSPGRQVLRAVMADLRGSGS
jgi:DNA-binding transcriptional ArsR family regulator